MERVCSLKELKEHPEEILNLLEEGEGPFFVDRGGKARAMLVDADEYLSNMQALNEFKRIFAEGSVQGKPQDIVREAWLKERMEAAS